MDEQEEPRLLKLKSNWDAIWTWPLRDPENPPIFIGREEEIERIKRFLISPRKGVLIIGGERGAGKTSTLYKSLHELQKSKIYPIRSLILSAKKTQYNTISEQQTIASESEWLTIQLINQIVRTLYLEEVKSQPWYYKRWNSIRLLFKIPYRKAGTHINRDHFIDCFFPILNPFLFF